MLLAVFALGCGTGACLVCGAALFGEWLSKRGPRRHATIRASGDVIDLRGAWWPR